MIPGWWQAIVLGLAAFRITRLIGWDDLPPVERARAWVVGRKVAKTGSFNSRAGLTNEHHDDVFEYDRPTLAHALGCAYCSGWWICLAWYVAWRLEASWTLTVAFPLALSSFVGTWARILDP